MEGNTKTQVIQAINAANGALSDLYEVNRYIENSQKTAPEGVPQKQDFMAGQTPREMTDMANNLLGSAGFKIERLNKELRDIPENLRNGMGISSVKTDASTVFKINPMKLKEAKASTDTLIEQIEIIRDYLNGKLANPDE